MVTTATTATIRRIRFWQHGHAVREILRAYAPGTDTIVDQMRSSGPLKRLAIQHVLVPLYFAREQGWTVRSERGEMAAILYLRRDQRAGVRVMHVDEISVSPRFRGGGLAQRLLALAEELAREERRPYLKLAVTVANTPAVTLYRRLGYQEQQHHYFTCVPSSVAAVVTPSDGNASLTLRPLGRRAAWAANRRFYQIELQASAPAVAELLLAYYPRGAGNVGVPKAGERRYAVEHGGKQIGYGDAYRRRGQWHLRVSLRPEVWGTTLEQEVIQRLLGAVTRTLDGQELTPPVALHVPSAAHFEALSAGVAGAPSVASTLGLREQSYDRMIMVKILEGK